MIMIGEEYTDVLCLDLNSDLCIDYYEFVSVESVLTDGYLDSFSLSNIGGIIGLGNSMK